MQPQLQRKEDLPDSHEDCHKLLLDLICYEIRSKRLSPEMEYLLDEHLETCPACREQVLAFRRMLPDWNVVRNFG